MEFLLTKRFSVVQFPPSSSSSSSSSSFSSSSSSYSSSSSSLSSLLPFSSFLVDVDANLLHPDLLPDINSLLSACFASHVEVKLFVVPGSDLKTSRLSLSLKRSSSSHFLATAGVHPFHASSPDLPPIPLLYEELKAMAREETCSAIGECGLDFSPDFPPKDRQIEIFRRAALLLLLLLLPLS